MLFCVLFVHPPCPRNSIILNSLLFGFSIFSSNPLELMAGFGDMPNFAYFMPYFKWLHCCSTDATSFNVTFPQTGTEHQNKNVFYEHVYTWKINTINCIFISTILNFRLRGQQSLPIKQTSKIKMASLVKRPCFALNGQNNLWGSFHQRKRLFFSV